MIEDSICNYLLNNVDILDALGNNHVFFDQAPANVKTPWIIVESRQGGMRERLSKKYVGPKQSISIIINADDPVLSRQIADVVVNVMDFYRGDMYGTRDTYFRCSPPYMREGILDVLECVVAVNVSFLEEITYPVPIG